MAKKPKFELKPWERGGLHHHFYEGLMAELMSVDEDITGKSAVSVQGLR